MTRLIANVLDLETTGKNEPEHRIIEYSNRLYDWVTGDFLKEITWRINPLRRIDPGAFKVHGISAEMVKDCMTFDVVAPAIVSLIRASAIVIAHNGGGPKYPGDKGFDYPFLKRELERVGEKMPDVPWFDTMAEGRFATHNGKIPTLGELCRTFDVEYDPAKAHSGSYDTTKTAESYFEGLRIGAWPDHGAPLLAQAA